MRLRLLLLPFFTAACAPAAAPPASPAPPTAAPAVADTSVPSIRWTRSSAEHRAVFLQTYGLATAQLERLAAGRPAGAWAVILDADETVLDNAQYQQERARAGLPYSEESWTAWVNRRAATALPGAAAFTSRVRALGGRVAIVTNRTEAECDPTRENLRAAGIAFDAVLCRPAGPSDKNARFEAVRRGAAPSPLPPLDVVMWVGDNIGDFPRLTQAVRTAPDSAFAHFGSTYIVLPNPMYGSWERTPLP